MLDLEPIKARLSDATPGPWAPVETHKQLCPDTYFSVAVVGRWEVRASIPRQARPEECDADFIANAPTDLAALVAEVEWLRTEKADYEADRLDCARQINDLSRKIEDLQHANISLKNTMDIRVAAPPSTLAKLHAEVERLRDDNHALQAEVILTIEQMERLREAIAKHRTEYLTGSIPARDRELWQALHI